MLKRAIDYVVEVYGNNPTDDQLHFVACLHASSHFEYALMFICLKQYFQY